jgi:hypothetical protein
MAARPLILCTPGARAGAFVRVGGRLRAATTGRGVRDPSAGLRGQARLMFSACGPFWPWVTSNVTAWPSWSSRKPVELIAE